MNSRWPKLLNATLWQDYFSFVLSAFLSSSIFLRTRSNSGPTARLFNHFSYFSKKSIGNCLPAFVNDISASFSKGAACASFLALQVLMPAITLDILLADRSCMTSSPWWPKPVEDVAPRRIQQALRRREEQQSKHKLLRTKIQRYFEEHNIIWLGILHTWETRRFSYCACSLEHRTLEYTVNSIGFRFTNSETNSKLLPFKFTYATIYSAPARYEKPNNSELGQHSKVKIECM